MSQDVKKETRPSAAGRAVQWMIQILLSILLTFSLLGTLGCGMGIYLVHTPHALLSQLEKQDAPAKVRSALEIQFAQEYNTTAVPPEVYLDVLTEDWLAHTMETYVTEHYSTNKDPNAIDFTVLEQSIIDYFEAYAAENSYEKDETYQTKLDETITHAENTVETAVDVFHLQTMSRAGILEKLLGMEFLLWIGLVLCGILTIGLLAMMLAVSRRLYFLGVSSFSAGLLLTVPTAVILAGGYIARFALKDAAVYAVCTGLMHDLVVCLLAFGVGFLAIGVALIGISVVHTRQKNI